MAAVYPSSAAKTSSSTLIYGDIDRTYQAAIRHSSRVRLLRVGVPVAIAAILLVVAIADYIPTLREIQLPGELGKLVIKGTKITMQEPKIAGFTSDGRPYVFTAKSAAQDIGNPDQLELQQIHATIEMVDKSTVEMTAPRGTYDLKGEILTLNDDIALVSSTGYAARLTQAVIDTRKGNVDSQQPVKVKLLNGFLNAKGLDVVDNGALLRFGGGVSMTINTGSKEIQQP